MVDIYQIKTQTYVMLRDLTFSIYMPNFHVYFKNETIVHKCPFSLHFTHEKFTGIITDDGNDDGISPLFNYYNRIYACEINGHCFVNERNITSFNGCDLPFVIDDPIRNVVCARGAFYAKKYNKIVYYNGNLRVIDAKKDQKLTKYMEWLPTTNEYIFSDEPIMQHECKYFAKIELMPDYERNVCERCCKSWLEQTPRINQKIRKYYCDLSKIKHKCYINFTQERITAPDIYVTFGDY